MPNKTQQYLSESEKSKIQAWLSVPEAALFKKAIASEILFSQFTGAELYTAKDRKPENEARAQRAFSYADDLQCVLDKMNECLAAEYPFYYTTINP